MILCDGMRSDVAFEEMGYVNSLCDTSSFGKKYISIVDNPSVSRTNYETLHTGVPSLIHGITSNLVLKKSTMDRNIFREVISNGGTTSCIGSSWIYDLYGKEKYNYLKHKEINKEDNDCISYGRFFSDDVPDAVDNVCEGIGHIFQISNFLIYKHQPDYVLIHVISTDKIGHEKGIGKEYRNEVSKIDAILGAGIPLWFDLGYDIVITSDHGMDKNNNHGGLKCDVMMAPLYILSKKGWDPSRNNSDKKYHHTDIAPMIVERIVPNTDFRKHIDELVSKSNYKQNRECIE